jgi:DNA-directed RNA polymerase specialized sigma24 family protein
LGDATAIQDVLNSSWPAFLDDLDRDPAGARRAFMAAAYPYLVASPPRSFFWFDPMRREDLAGEVVLHLTAHDFRRLRGYRDCGRPFLCWLRTAAYNRAVEIHRRERHPVNHTADADVLPTTAPGPDPAEQTALQEAAREVRRVLLGFDNKLCRILLRLRLERQLKNREITRVLGLAPDRNADVGNWYRRCRLELVDRLQEAGIDAATFAT